MSYYIGFDLGTSSVKLCLTDGKGKLIKEVNKSYELLQPVPGWKEIDPEKWWEKSCEAMQELLEGVDKEKVCGIGVTGQMHTLILLDEQGKTIRPALMWNDTRTADLIPRLKEAVQGTEVEYLKRIISTGSPAANLLWVKENEPDNYHKIKKFLIGPDYIVYRLTGKYGTDYCEASTSSMYDTEKKCWSPVLRDFLELKEEVYPEVKGSAEIAGLIKPELARKFGIGPSTVVIVGTGDNPAASIPTGCLGKNDPVFSMGTSGVLMFPRKDLDYDAKGKNILFGFDREHCNILVQGVVQSCGSTFSWWNLDIMKNKNFLHIDAMFDPEKLGEGTLLFYPHLVGDKTIYADPALRGAFIGLSTDTTREEMTLAVMEGIAFALKQLAGEMHLDNVKLKELKVIGGGAKSNIWMQILADVMGVTIAQMGGEGGAGYGIALLAAYVCGEIESIEKISEHAVKVRKFFYPRKRSKELYEKKFQRYMRIHDALLSIG